MHVMANGKFSAWFVVWYDIWITYLMSCINITCHGILNIRQSRKGLKASTLKRKRITRMVENLADED